MGHLLHYMIPFQNFFQILFISLFTYYCWLQAITKLSQHKRIKMLLFFMDIVGKYRPIWLFSGWYIWTFWCNTWFYIRKVKSTCYLKHFSMLCNEFYTFKSLKGVLHHLTQKAPKLACFVLFLKIINIFWKNNIYII